jgi:5-methylcytosine-specific restriction endonuclease McrA
MSRALILNATFEPLAVVPLRRAVVLVLSDKADVVELSGGEWHSATAAVAVPAVIRLRRYVRVPYRARAPLTRNGLMARDGGRCQYCAERATTVDHVMPRSRGGRHRWENVVAACGRCNTRKADRTLAELGWSLPRRPTAPTGRAWLVLGVATVDPRWEPYLALA